MQGDLRLTCRKRVSRSTLIKILTRRKRRLRARGSLKAAVKVTQTAAARVSHIAPVRADLIAQEGQILTVLVIQRATAQASQKI